MFCDKSWQQKGAVDVLPGFNRDGPVPVILQQRTGPRQNIGLVQKISGSKHPVHDDVQLHQNRKVKV